MRDDDKKMLMIRFAFNAVMIFAIPAAFVIGQNYPNSRLVAIYSYVILQLVLAILVSCAFWFLFLRRW